MKIKGRISKPQFFRCQKMVCVYTIVTKLNVFLLFEQMNCWGYTTCLLVSESCQLHEMNQNKQRKELQCLVAMSRDSNSPLHVVFDGHSFLQVDWTWPLKGEFLQERLWLWVSLLSRWNLGNWIFETIYLKPYINNFLKWVYDLLD